MTKPNQKFNMRALLLAIVFLLFFFLQLSSDDIPAMENAYGQLKVMELPHLPDSTATFSKEDTHEVISELFPAADLHQAIIQGDQERVAFLLQDSPTLINRPSMTTGDAPLHVAIAHQRNTIASLLLEKGAQPDLKNRFGETPLHFAKSPHSITILAEAGASLETADRMGTTPLHRFCQSNQIEAVRRLLVYNVDPEIKDNLGYTALHFAVQRNLADITILLLMEGASPHAKTLAGHTAFYLAKEQGLDKILSALLAYGAHSEPEHSALGKGNRSQP